MSKLSLSQQLSHSPKNRNDNTLELKWSTPLSKPYVDPGIDFSHDRGVTDPSGADDADINNIVARFHKTGVLPNINVPGVFADVSSALSYQDSLQVIINAENQFMALDAKTRKKFSNSPAEFLEFVENPENGPELVKMGLATLVEPTPSPASPSPAGGQPAPKERMSKPKVDEN